MPPQEVGDAHVEEVELGGCHRLAPPRPAPGEHEKPDERVGKDVEVGAYRGGRHTGVARHVGEVELLAVAHRRDLQEAREVDEVADQRLAPYLFSQVGIDVSVELLLRVFGVVYLRQPAVKEVPAEVELRDLRGSQREQVRLPRPPAEQVHAAALELAAARPAQHEVHSLRLYQVVHLVEQDRQLLDLIDHDHRRIRRNIGAALGHDLAQSRRILGKRQVLAAAQQVYDRARVELPAQQRGLAGAPRTEQKQRLSCRELSDGQRSRIHTTERIGKIPENQRGRR